MKKLLTAMMLLLPLAAMAQDPGGDPTVDPAVEQHWTAPDFQTHFKSTVIYAQVNINGQMASANNGLELAAFIGEECRADALAQEAMLPTGGPSGNSVFTLNVYGSDGSDGVNESEIGKTITFRAFYQNIEYQFNIETVKFQGDATLYEPSTPLVLNLDAVTGIYLAPTIDVNQPTFPYELNLSPYVKLVYGNVDREKSGDSKINEEVSPITYTWTTDNEEMLTFDNAKNKVTIQNAGTATANLVVYIGRATFPAAGELLTTTFNATIASIPVTGITCNVTDLNFYAYDNLKDYLVDKVKIEPDNASDKDFTLTAEPAGGFDLQSNWFTKGGKFVITVSPTDNAYKGEKPTINVTAYVRPTTMTTTDDDNTIEVGIGEDVYKAIEAVTSFEWPEGYVVDEYAKKDVTYTFGEENYVDATSHLALKEGSVRVTVALPDDGLTPSFTFVGQKTFTLMVNIVSRLVVTAVLNPEATTFVKNGSVSTATPAYVRVSNPGNEPFESTDLSITFNDRYAGFPYAEQISIVKKETDGQGITTYEFSIMPLYVGITSFDVTYKGNVLTSGRIEILKKEELSKGWTWLSLITDGGNVSEFLTKDDIVEVRSQDKLTYNDPQYGYFGHLTTLSANEGMYKVMTNKETSVNWGSNAILKSDAEVVPNKVINKGFNWVNYPYEFDVTPDRIPEFLGADFTPADGDRIITQSSGFAVYKAETGTWEAKEFALKEGKGLMYYSTGDGAKTITFNLVPIAKPAEGNVRAESFTMPSLADEILQYDVHAFADNMSMIAEVENLDFPEDYTLGVFVNGECRGRGRVAVDGKMFVSAVGISGENVTFKLVNNFTGDMLPVEGSVSFSMVKGSLKAPVKLIAGDATGINKVDRTQQTNEMYDLSGRRITGSQRGVIIERMDNGTIRKVVKK